MAARWHEGKPWTAGDDEALRRLLRDGCTRGQMALELSRTVHSVGSRLSDLGLASRGEKTWRPCMCCRQMFASAGIGNRLCASCRAAA